MNEKEFANKHDDVTQSSQEEAVTGVTSADPKSVEDKEVPSNLCSASWFRIGPARYPGACGTGKNRTCP